MLIRPWPKKKKKCLLIQQSDFSAQISAYAMSQRQDSVGLVLKLGQVIYHGPILVAEMQLLPIQSLSGLWVS